MVVTDQQFNLLIDAGYIVDDHIPTLEEVWVWLSDDRGLFIEIYPVVDWTEWRVTVHNRVQRYWKRVAVCDSREAALSAGVDDCLQILANKNQTSF